MPSQNMVAERPAEEVATLNRFIVDVVEDLVKVANCGHTGSYCNIPYNIVIRRGVVEFKTKRGTISIRRGVAVVDAGSYTLMVDADFGTASVIKDAYFLLGTGNKITWDGAERVFTATEFVEFLKENIRKIISHEGL